MGRRRFIGRAGTTVAALIAGGGGAFSLSGCGGHHSSGNGGNDGGPVIPVGYWSGDDTAVDSVGGNNGKLSAGVGYGKGIVNDGFIFNGTNGVVLIPDATALNLARTFTITAIIGLNAYPASGSSAMIFCRGDGSGNPFPYSLGVTADGLLFFAVSDKTTTAQVTVAIPANQNLLITAEFDFKSGLMTLSVNDTVNAHISTSVRPYVTLDATASPGVAIGNSPDPAAGNQPFNGLIDELQVYDGLLESQVVAD